MSWIALKMLVGDRAKFFGIVLGLTFAALLITQQGSIFCGLMCRTAGQIFDIRGADLWVMDPNVRYVDDVKPMIENNLYRVRGVRGVQWAVPLYKGIGRAKINSFEVDTRGQPVFQQVAAGATAPGTQGEARPKNLREELMGAQEVPLPKFGHAVGPDGAPRLDEHGHPLLTDHPPSPESRLYRFVETPEGARETEGPSRYVLVAVDDPSRRVLVRQVRHEVIEQVILLGLDDASLVGAPSASRILAGQLDDLRRPDSVLVDYTRLPKLFPGEPWQLKPPEVKWEFARDGWEWLGRSVGLIPPTEPTWRDRQRDANRRFYSRFLGRELEMNDRRAVIVGVCEATRTFQSNAVAYTRFSRAKLFVPRERKMLSYILAKTEANYNPDQVAALIRVRTGLKARTSTEFIADTMFYFMKYTGIPINFGITALLGFLVGTAIAGQTFYNFTLDNIKQFGALKAMGATNLRIVGMICLQATVVGLLGYGLGVGLAALFGEASKGGELAFYTPLELLPITGAAVILICLLSSLLSVRRVIVLEPAVVFRG
jgi:putative ABC transport system permease protein